MNFYSSIGIVAGSLAFLYVMLRIFKIDVKRTSSSDSSGSEKTIEENKEEKSLIESTELKVENDKSVKRKLEKTNTSMKFVKVKPNFFLGFQVFNPEIHKKVKKIQEEIIDRNSLLHSALIKVSTLHVTLGVTHLANETEIKKIKDKLDDWINHNREKFFDKPIVLNFSKINFFENGVAYVGIEKCQNYEKLCEISDDLNNMLSSSNFSIDKRSFTPHLTILKLSKDYKLLRLKKSFKKDFDILKECTDHFGEQELSVIQLLKMETHDEKGYYKCFHQINITDNYNEMDHSVCCAPIPKPKKKISALSHLKNVK